MKRIVQFFKDSYAELKRVVWPTREQVISSTQVVLVSLVLFGIALGALDLIFTQAILFLF
ncbi:MAG: preprotein translocase subunit SecE [Spirochaetaceae bacterium]|nr:MAG: preprotein translocase subunit SecE [Spirochaetaceae bacterium]